MESKDIVFTGLGRAVSDLDIPDGELSVSHNIIRDNGSMKPIWMPEAKFELSDGERIVYVHSTSENKKNYIVEKNGSLYFFTDEPEDLSFIATIGGEGLQLASIGNTIVVTSSEGLHYLLFKDGSYKNLGQKPPELTIKFFLQSKLMTSENPFTMSSINTEDQGKVVIIEDTDITDASYMELAAVNKLVADATNDNHIVYPCFVRYAYRMYDGVSYTMHSAPILLVPNTQAAPVVCTTVTAGAMGEEWSAKVMASKVQFLVADGYDSLSDWSDIIQSVDIFMSEQISTRGANTKTTQIVKLSDIDASRSTNYGFFSSLSLLSYEPHTFMDVIGSIEDDENYTAVLYDDSINRNDLHRIIKDTSNFYKVRSLNLEDITTIQTRDLFDDETVSSSGANLSSITLSERLSDDYQTHDTFIATHLFPYNSRLNMSGLTRKLFEGFPVSSMVADMSYSGETKYYTVYTHIKKEGREIVLKSKTGWMFSMNPMYLYYPDPDAYKMTIIEGSNVVDGTELVDGYELDLVSHPMLNGAIYFNALKVAPTSASRRLSAPYATEDTISLLNKVYTSEVNNPYYFPLEGINTIGIGEIKGVASVTKALSQGQFGQFPLYVFSTDGVWAMEVASNGLYSSIKPISRDVCINGDSITQTDNAVLFVSEKGVMMIDGSEISCISDMMNGRSFDISSVSMLPDVMAKESIPSDLRGIHDFMDYARAGRMAYDYPNGRVILYAEGMDYVYVFSLTSLTWATLGASIDNAVNDYPDTYVQTGTGVKNLSTRIDYDNASLVKTLLVTRPLKLGDDGYKTVYEMVSRGAMDRKKGALLLWGSYDGIDYTLIADAIGNRIYRTGGTAYRYYRIGVVGEMPVGESLSMVSMLFRRRYGNKLR